MNQALPIDAARPGLAGPLFGKGDTSVFAVLSGASARELVDKLYELEPEFCCLYSGDLEPDTASVAPYLVQVASEGEFTEWVLREGWGAHWGIFLVSTADLRTLRNHFREFLKVELPDHRIVLLRYYDPRVFRSFIPACNATELGKFFGPVQHFVVEGETPETGIKYSLAGKALKPEPFQLKKVS